MSVITVYRITREYRGKTDLVTPYIPESRADIEDAITPRIPVCTSILQCIRSLELPFYITKENPSITLYVYGAEVADYVYSPNILSVPDSWRTGELWMMQPTSFNLLYSGTLRKHMDINDVYSRYAFTKSGCDEVIDRITATECYGDEESFSFIELDSAKLNGK